MMELVGGREVWLSILYWIELVIQMNTSLTNFVGLLYSFEVKKESPQRQSTSEESSRHAFMWLSGLVGGDDGAVRIG
jgi:hypothetical protein